MTEHRAWQRTVGRRLLVGLAVTLSLYVPSRAMSQEGAQASDEQVQEKAEQQEQSLKQQLEAAEQLRKKLESELRRVQAEVETLKGKQGDGATRPAQRQPRVQEPVPFAGGQRGGQAGLLPGRRPRNVTRHIKIFKLRHRKAEEMREIVMILGPVRGGADISIDPSESQRTLPVQPAGGIAAQSRDDLRVVADARSNALIVRASDNVLKQVENLVASFDVPPGAEPVFGDASQGVFTVRFVDPEYVTEVLRDLGVDATRVSNTNTLSVRASETTLKEVGDLIEALDVENQE